MVLFFQVLSLASFGFLFVLRDSHKVWRQCLCMGFAWAQAQAQSDIYGRIVGNLFFGGFLLSIFLGARKLQKKKDDKGCFTCLRFLLSCQARMGKIHREGGGYLFFLCSLLGWILQRGYLGEFLLFPGFFLCFLYPNVDFISPQPTVLFHSRTEHRRPVCGTSSRHLTNSLTQPG